MRTRLLPILISLTLLTVGLAGCGGAEAESEPGPESNVMLTPVGNQMTFEQTEFTVTAGTEVTLTFDNTATSPAMEHNVVLLTNNENDTINRVGNAAVAAADNAYIPDDDAILAYTDLAKPGETVTVTFTAPTPPLASSTTTSPGSTSSAARSAARRLAVSSANCRACCRLLPPG